MTAFDVNSFQSGPSSIESPRNTKPVTPAAPASNFQNHGDAHQQHRRPRGRAGQRHHAAEPTLDPATGRFSGPFPPANGGELALRGRVRPAGRSRRRVRSRCAWTASTLGRPRTTLTPQHVLPHCDRRAPAPRSRSPSPVTQDQIRCRTAPATRVFNAVAGRRRARERFGGNASLQAERGSRSDAAGQLLHQLLRPWLHQRSGRICASIRAVHYNGARWFDGPSPAQNETVDNPDCREPGERCWTGRVDRSSTTPAR